MAIKPCAWLDTDRPDRCSVMAAISKGRLPSIAAVGVCSCGTLPVTQRQTVDRHHLKANLQRRLDWSAGSQWVAGRGSCRGSIQPQHGIIMLELVRDMRHDRTFPLRVPLYKYTAEPLVYPAAVKIADSARNS
jgi:hypothetical protein